MSTTQEQAAAEDLTDEKLARIAYAGFDSYWTETCPGIESEAWAAAAKAVIAAYVAAHPAPAAQPVVPEGWQVVPKEPTPDMRNAYHAVTHGDAEMLGAAGSRWAAMLYAAPSSPAAPALGACPSGTALSAPAADAASAPIAGADRLGHAVALLQETLQPGAYGLRSTLAARIESFLKEEA